LPRSGYLAVLRIGGVPRPLVSSMVGRIADSVASLAIVVLVHATTGSYSAAGVTAAAYAIGTAAGAPLAGRALDRAGQRRVLPALAGAFGLSLTALALTAGRLDFGGVLFVAAIAGLTRPPLEAALRALWPRLLASDRLDLAYALDSTLQELVWIAGPLLLAGMLSAGAERLPLLGCAALSVVGAASYAASPDLPAGEVRPGRDRLGPLRSPRLRRLLASAVGYGIAVGILVVALAAFASAHGSPAAVGALIAIWGAGSLVGGIVYGSRRWSGPVEQRALVLLVALGAALMLLAAAPSLPVVALLMLVVGLPLSPWLGCLSAAVQRAAPSRSAAEAFTWIFAVITLGDASGNAAGGALIQLAGPGIAFLIAGGAALGGAGVASLMRERGRRYL
jgi:predicted MFS family arabinose efflux permease